MNTITTNNLKHTIKLPDLDIQISLDDDCKNGHNDFSITGTVWTPGKPHMDRFCEAAGCCHDEILKKRPDLKIFVDLHLSDANGVPLYAIENGFYHLQNSTKEVVMDYLRITEDEYNYILQAKDKFYFAYLLFSLQIPERWKKQAALAITILEDMTGKKFVDDSVKSQLNITPEQLKETAEKVKNGYYTAENIAKLENEKIQAVKDKIINDLIKDRAKAIKKANDAFNIRMFVLLSGLSIDNFIYYDHTNTGVFNWKGFDKKITIDQFEAFIKTAAENKPVSIPGFKEIVLPAGITFKFNEDK